jgi:hypothetical protein
LADKIKALEVKEAKLKEEYEASAEQTNKIDRVYDAAEEELLAFSKRYNDPHDNIPILFTKIEALHNEDSKGLIMDGQRMNKGEIKRLVAGHRDLITTRIKREWVKLMPEFAPKQETEEEKGERIKSEIYAFERLANRLERAAPEYWAAQKPHRKKLDKKVDATLELKRLRKEYKKQVEAGAKLPDPKVKGMKRATPVDKTGAAERSRLKSEQILLEGKCGRTPEEEMRLLEISHRIVDLTQKFGLNHPEPPKRSKSNA